MLKLKQSGVCMNVLIGTENDNLRKLVRCHLFNFFWFHFYYFIFYYFLCFHLCRLFIFSSSHLYFVCVCTFHVYVRMSVYVCVCCVRMCVCEREPRRVAE